MTDITDEDIREMKEAEADAWKNYKIIGRIKIYIEILQDGDPENENPKEILDYIYEELTDKGSERIMGGPIQ